MISKKVREFFVSLMEATNSDDNCVHYDEGTQYYSGVFNQAQLAKFIELDVISLIEVNNGLTVIQLNARDDFISGFAAGVNEARLGRDQYYADYNANPMAFSLGFEHYCHWAKKKSRAAGYRCHGFLDEISNDIYLQ